MRAFLCLMFAIGCRREVEQAKPDPIVKSAAPSAPTTMPAPPATVAARCVDGSTDGIGLGTVGGFGGAPIAIPEPAPVVVQGSATEAIESVTKAEIDDALCPKLLDVRKCLTALTRGDLAFEAVVDAKLTIDAGGELKVVLDGGTLKDDAMKACVRDGLLTGKLAHGPGEGRYSVRIVARAVNALTVKDHDVVVAGKLPPDLVRRIVRAHFTRIKTCALAVGGPSKGMITTRFTIDATGAVAATKLDEGGTTITLGPVQTCVLGVFRTLTFPEPESGTVDVVYPIDFGTK